MYTLELESSTAAHAMTCGGKRRHRDNQGKSPIFGPRICLNVCEMFNKVIGQSTLTNAGDS